MKIELRYFTGTGNAWKVLNACRETFEAAAHQVHLDKLDPNESNLNADIIGLAFPVYAFGMPRIVFRYLRSLKKYENTQDVFVIVTPGDVIGASTTTKKCERLLKRKNCRLVYSDVLGMPNNWIPFTHTDSAEENLRRVDEGVKRAHEIAADILDNKHSFFNIKQVPFVFRVLGDLVNFMFRNFGLWALKNAYNVYPSCNSCGLCAKACPTQSIKIVNGKPKWSKTCEQCMRCVHICPQASIYQRPASTKGKDRYFAPDFDPLKM